MRYADIEFDYGVDEFFTKTTTVEPTDTTKSTQTSTQPEVVVDEEVGIIVAVPSHDDKESHKDRRNERKAKKQGVVGEYEVVYW